VQLESVWVHYLATFNINNLQETSDSACGVSKTIEFEFTTLALALALPVAKVTGLKLEPSNVYS